MHYFSWLPLTSLLAMCPLPVSILLDTLILSSIVTDGPRASFPSLYIRMRYWLNLKSNSFTAFTFCQVTLSHEAHPYLSFLLVAVTSFSRTVRSLL